MSSKSRGKLIIIEGTDGSGKSVQTKLLTEKLQKKGYEVAAASFPQYGKKSAGLVEEYLNGKYGKPENVSPYAASLFYALDRFDLSQELKKLLKNGFIVVLDRYVDSNAGHQGGKIKNSKERNKFLGWLYEIEYKILNIPKPNLTLILHMPADISHKLIAQKKTRSYLKKGKTRDTHEADLNHLKAAEASYLWLARKYPKDHLVIECAEKGQPLSPEKIQEEIWRTVQKEFDKK